MSSCKIIIRQPRLLVTAETVLAELAKAGFVVNFYDGTSLADLCMGMAAHDLPFAKLVSNTLMGKLTEVVAQQNHVRADFLAYAQSLIDDPNLVDHYRTVCYQEKEKHALGGFVCAYAYRVAGKRKVHVDRFSGVWGYGSAFPLRPQG
jgi:hypothetical protein